MALPPLTRVKEKLTGALSSFRFLILEYDWRRKSDIAEKMSGQFSGIAA